MLVDLPAEIWIQIFYLAADEDIIIQHGLPTILAKSAWYKDGDVWKLRSPQEAMELLQRRSYAMKKVGGSKNFFFFAILLPRGLVLSYLAS